MRLLVAGGAGFIGSHLCHRLIDEGHDVLCVDSLLTGSKKNLEDLIGRPHFTFEEDDIAVHQPRNQIEGIFHLASPASPVGYWQHPFETVAANTVGTQNLLQLARRNGARFLFTSTSEVYGNPLVHPQPETYFGNVNPLGPRSVYDEGKRLGETLTAEFHRRYGVDTRIARLFNTYGPRNQVDDGRMVPEFIRCALLGQPMQVHGDGLQTRSLCYVDDTVEGLMKLFFTPDLAGEVVNIGNPDEMPVIEIAHRICLLATGTTRFVEHRPAREEDPQQRRPDISKAQRLLGWKPQVTATEGLRRTIEWMASVLGEDPAAHVADAPSLANLLHPGPDGRELGIRPGDVGLLAG